MSEKPPTPSHQSPTVVRPPTLAEAPTVAQQRAADTSAEERAAAPQIPAHLGRFEPADFGLLAVIEVFRSEMDYVRKNGGAKLLQRLKAKDHYPHYDLDREPVA